MQKQEYLAFLRGKDASASLSMLPLALTLIPERFLTGWFCSTESIGPL